jgi:hypothetical protein
MTVSPEKMAELRVKHLEMLQALITRMAGYGASFKSYCITVTRTARVIVRCCGRVDDLQCPLRPSLAERSNRQDHLA